MISKFGYLNLRFVIDPGTAAVIGSVIAGGATLLGQHQQNNYNQDQIRKQNQYNSPANQMRLLGQAGLSPNLVLSNGSLGSAIQSDVALQQENAGAKVGDVVKDQINAQTALANAQARNIDADTDLKVSEKGFRATEIDTLVKSANQQIKESNQRIQESARQLLHLDFVDAYLSSETSGQRYENNIKLEKWLQERVNTQWQPKEKAMALRAANSLAELQGMQTRIGERELFEMQKTFALRLAAHQKGLDLKDQQIRLTQFQADNAFYDSQFGKLFIISV